MTKTLRDYIVPPKRKRGDNPNNLVRGGNSVKPDIPKNTTGTCWVVDDNCPLSKLYRERRKNSRFGQR